MSGAHPKHSAVPVAAVLGAVLSMQFGAAFATTLFDEAGAAGTVTVRLVLAAAILCAIARPRVRTWTRREWRGALALGGSLAVMNASFYEALARLPLAATVTIEFLGPLTLAAALSRRLRDVLWVLLALGGVVLLGIGEGDAAIGGLDLVGVVFALVAGAGWAGYIVAGSHVATTLSGLTGLAGASTIAALAVLPFGIASAGSTLLSPTLLAAGLAVALLSSAIPYSLEIRALRDLSKGVFAILIALEPAAAALAGAVVLGQFVDPTAAVGIALVVAAGVGALRNSPT
ncbi:EamA family transporter [Rhodococcus chondri]|uniref:EamA family transporter n=1 Tax=Rhodococcus chondri TaxID=3065941 RepID=A0ABU7JZW9_9NOCA|nr:EamA family transporter [Rhodococcus sp. CC-R104]MEE2034842.1 EamA family transporter [Rhodococcus sp. CC-R104]